MDELFNYIYNSKLNVRIICIEMNAAGVLIDVKHPIILLSSKLTRNRLDHMEDQHFLPLLNNICMNAL